MMTTTDDDDAACNVANKHTASSFHGFGRVFDVETAGDVANLTKLLGTWRNCWGSGE